MGIEQLTAMESQTRQLDAELSPTADGAIDGGAPAGADAAPAVDPAAAWAAVAQSIGALLSIAAPELRAVYTEEACRGWGERVVPVAAKYGWDSPDGMPEVSLGIATLGLAVPSVMVIRARIAAAREEARAAAEAARAGATRRLDQPTDDASPVAPPQAFGAGSTIPGL